MLFGFMGELNMLYLELCGCVVCYVDKSMLFNFWVIFIIIVFVVGNIVIIVVLELFYDEVVVFKDKFILIGIVEGVF